MELDCRELPVAVHCPFCKKYLYVSNPEMMDRPSVNICSHLAFAEDSDFDLFVGKNSTDVYTIKIWTGGWTQATLGFKNSKIPANWSPTPADFGVHEEDDESESE